MPGPNQPVLIDVITVDAPGPGEILIDMTAVGVCHTEFSVVSGALGTKYPVALGHEGAGIVEAVGEGVTKAAPGDKVLLTFNSCGECAQCRDGAAAYCHPFKTLNLDCLRADGSSRLHHHGADLSDNFFGQSSLSSKAIASERNVVRLGADADVALVAPLGCGIHTGAGAVMRSLEAKPGQSLVVVGGGTVGLSAVLGGKIAGCSPIIVIEPQTSRREMAAELGADHFINPEAGDAVAAVRAILPDGADL